MTTNDEHSAESNDDVPEPTGDVTDGRSREGPSQVERYLSRRRYLMAAGSVTGVSILAGCGELPGGNGPTPTTTSTGTTTESTQSPETTTNETTTQQQGAYHQYSKQQLTQKYPALEILSPDPPNGQAAQLSTYTDFITPVDAEYIRSHYNSPRIDESDHTVSLTGMADSDVDITMDELKHDFSTATITHTMQCSGNGRAYFEPQVAGNQWTFGAVDNAVYTGTPVSEILDAYGVDTSDGRWLSVMGADAPEGEDVFCRSIPMQKVKTDCLLAYERNGSPLTAEHGFPVRLLVPGWYGCNNVKWVDRMHVMDMMVYGQEWEDGDQRTFTHWQQYSYRIIPAQDDDAEQYQSIDIFDTREQMENTDQIRNAYMYDQMVKSLIGYPGQGATVSPNPAGVVEVVGVAWAGDDAVSMVELSTDGGETFEEAEFFGPSPGPTAWRQFRYMWSDPTPGEHTLVSRATDEQGRSQPATISAPDEGLRGIENDSYPWNQDGYGSTAYMPESVTITVERNTTSTEGNSSTNTSDR